MQQREKITEDINKIVHQPQGGRDFGRRLQVQERDLDRIGQEYRQRNPDADPAQIEKYKQKFMVYDRDHKGELGMEEVKWMLEKLGQPKTHLEIKKMIAQVDKSGSGTIEYIEFLEMMLGPGGNSILKKILMFEELAKEKEAPKKGDLPPRRSLTDLP
jgi:allograft inflammatory factor 1